LFLPGRPALERSLELVAQDVTHRGLLGALADVSVVVRALLGAAELLDGEADPALLRLDREDLSADLVAHLENVRGLLDSVVSDLADVDEAFHTVFDLSKRTEVGELGDHAVDSLAL